MTGRTARLALAILSRVIYTVRTGGNRWLREVVVGGSGHIGRSASRVVQGYSWELIGGSRMPLETDLRGR